MKLKILVSSFILILSAISVARADMILLFDDPGVWKNSPVEVEDKSRYRDYGWSISDANMMSKKMEKIIDDIKSYDARPKGVDRQLSGRVEIIYDYRFSTFKEKTYLPVSGYLLLNAFGRHNFNGKSHVSSDGPAMMIYFNGPYLNLSGYNNTYMGLGDEYMKTDDQYNNLGGDGILLEPVKTGEIQGFPIYDDLIFISRNKKPLWVPVSREMVIKALIRQWEEKDAEYNKSMARVAEDDKEWEREAVKMIKDGTMNPKDREKYRQIREKARQDREQSYAQARNRSRELFAKDNDPWLLTNIPGEAVKMLKKELESLSASERQMDAYFGGFDPKGHDVCNSRTISCLVDPETPGAKKLVTQNPVFYDKTLPKSAIQLIVIREYSGFVKELNGASARTNGDPFVKQRQVEIIRSIDWNKMAETYMD